MHAPEQFASFVGNPRVVQILKRALAQERLPHALIFAGPAGVGKRSLALLLAQRLNCLTPEHDDACGRCRSCQKILAASHPDVHVLSPDGAYIKIEQIRKLIGEIAFQPFEGRYRVAVITPAEQMRPETANSLLKTLEEPASRTFLILVTTNPYALLATIRSRCRMLQFGRIPEEEIEQYLTTKAGRTKPEARLAAAFCDGSLAAALSFDAAEFNEVRGQGLRYIKQVLGGRSFTETSQLAAVLAKDKESFLLWMDSVAALLKDVYYAQVAPERMAQKDIAEELRSLALSVTHAQVLSGIEGMNKLRRALQQNVNRQLALEAFFLTQRGLQSRVSGSGIGGQGSGVREEPS